MYVAGEEEAAGGGEEEEEEDEAEGEVDSCKWVRL